MFWTVAAQADLKIDVGGTVGNVSAADFLRPNDIVLNDVRALRVAALPSC